MMFETQYLVLELPCERGALGQAMRHECKLELADA